MSRLKSILIIENEALFSHSIEATLKTISDINFLIYKTKDYKEAYQVIKKVEQLNFVFFNVDLYSNHAHRYTIIQDFIATIRYNFANVKLLILISYSNNYLILEMIKTINPDSVILKSDINSNDFENMTLNGSRPLFNDKLNLSFNVGYQRDNLEKQKTQATSRLVGAINATLKATDKITITGSYSNFSTHTNKNLNQFDDINDSDLTDEDFEALDFKQLSQNANVNVNWVLAEGRKNSQNLNINYSLASSANEQAGIIRIGQANNFHNANSVYTITFPKKSLHISTSLNYTYSDVGRDDSDAYGGALNISKKFFEDKLNTTFGVAYNTNNNKEIKTDVLNFRTNVSMVVAEKHSFSLNAVQLFRTATNQNTLNELTVTFGYAYMFDVGKPKKKR